MTPTQHPHDNQSVPRRSSVLLLSILCPIPCVSHSCPTHKRLRTCCWVCKFCPVLISLVVPPIRDPSGMELHPRSPRRPATCRAVGPRTHSRRRMKAPRTDQEQVKLIYQMMSPFFAFSNVPVIPPRNRQGRCSVKFLGALLEEQVRQSNIFERGPRSATFFNRHIQHVRGSFEPLLFSFVGRSRSIAPPTEPWAAVTTGQ